MSDRKEYYSRWYMENRVDLLRRRRERYRTDPVCRQKKARLRKARSRSTRKHLPPLEVRFGEYVRVYWSAGVLAKCLGRSMRTIDSWQARGLLPETLVRRGGVRYYSEEMILAVRNVLDSSGGRVKEKDALLFYSLLLKWIRSDFSFLDLGFLTPEDNVQVEELRRILDDNGDAWAYTLAGVAAELGRQVATVSNWRRYGIIPPSRLRYWDEEIYTPGMVTAMKDVVARSGGTVKWDDLSVRRELRAVWQAETKAYKCQQEGAKRCLLEKIRESKRAR